MQKSGIDIGTRVFFGTSHSSTHGYYDHQHKCIWIDASVLEKFLTSPSFEDKAYLFRVIFHEMQHAVQHHNIDNKNINYLTYNFIKESIIREYDDDYYSQNYKSIFMESDARKEEILGSLEFLKGLNPEFICKLKKKYQYDYIIETNLHPIYRDSSKTLLVGQNNTKINVSDYVGFLIKSNPEILFEHSILRIEYNPDGSYKSLETLLDEFEQIEPTSSDYSNMYSIYYGLILKAAQQTNHNDTPLQERISAFFEKGSGLVSTRDMQDYYSKQPLEDVREVYQRFLKIVTPSSPSAEHSSQGGDTNVDYQPR